jgi:hypothetical protein
MRITYIEAPLPAPVAEEHGTSLPSARPALAQRRPLRLK